MIEGDILVSKFACSHATCSATPRQLNDDIAAAWMNADRINALKLAIQAAKLLRDTSVAAFYPILFVLVADIMVGSLSLSLYLKWGLFLDPLSVDLLL
jgi:hypothetical protein